MNTMREWLYLGGMICLTLFILSAIAVPLSAMVWWAGWRRRDLPDTSSPGPPVAPSQGPFLVYLSGIGDISGEYSTRYEDEFLELVAARVPGLQVIIDVFGYSVENLSMTSQRALGWFWGWVHAIRQMGGPLKTAGRLIFLRNTLHIAASADRRYGPIYNYGVAEMILKALLRKGYQPGSGSAITLLGYSGGGQIALGTAGYIQATLRAPVQVISLAGIMNSSRSLDRISLLTHIYGTRDHQHSVGALIFPSRWRIFPGSVWNQAAAKGKIRVICMGPMRHAGKGSYLDGRLKLEDGRSYVEATADTVAELIRHIEPVSGDNR